MSRFAGSVAEIIRPPMGFGSSLRDVLKVHISPAVTFTGSILDLIKYSDDQERDDHGRFASSQQAELHQTLEESGWHRATADDRRKNDAVNAADAKRGWGLHTATSGESKAFYRGQEIYAHPDRPHEAITTDKPETRKGRSDWEHTRYSASGYKGNSGRGNKELARYLSSGAKIKKYSPDQERDDHGRFSGGGVDIMVGVHPIAAKALGRSGVRAVKDAIANRASQAETLKALAPMYAAASDSRGETMKLDAQGKPPEGFFENRNYGTAENPISHTQVMEKLDAQSRAYAGPSGPSQDRQAFILVGPPAAGKSGVAEQMAGNTRSAIVDPDDAKREIPEFRDGLGAGDVHEESSAMGKQLEARMTSQGTNIIIPTVGANADGIQTRIDRLQGAGYKVSLVDVSVGKDEATRRMASRALNTGRIIAEHAVISTGDRPSQTYDALKGKADGYARIDASGPRGSEDTVESRNFSGFASRKAANARGGEETRGIREEHLGREVPERLALHKAEANGLDRPAAVKAKAGIARVMRAALVATGMAVSKQVRRRLKVLGKSDADDIATLIAALRLSTLDDASDDLASYFTDLAADSGRSSLAQLGLDKPKGFFGQVNDRAAAWADDYAAQLVGIRSNSPYSITQATRDMVRGTITEGLAGGLGSSEIADTLSQSYAFSEERADLIANTETRRANSAGQLESYRVAREAGVVVQKEWLVDDDPCPECQENADEGPIDLDDEFPSGDDAAPAHPHCNCSVSPVISSSGDGAEEEDPK